MADLCILYGALRSGTTMLRLMVDNHPQIVCPGEADFLADALIPGEGASGWSYDRDHLLGSRIFRASRAEPPEAEDAAEAFRELTDQLRGGESGCLVLDMHRGLDRILDLAPDVHVLHLLRDPRDVARSAIGMGWAGNVYHGTRIWLETERIWERCLPRLKPAQVYELHYEDLVRSPETALTEVCGFLGVPYDPAMLSYDETSTYGAPDPSLVEQWRRKQSPRDLGLVEGRLGPLLEARGYAPSGHPQISPNQAERMALLLEHKASIWKTRIKRYGVVDPLLISLGQRLPLDGPVRRARRRIDEKSIAYLK